MSLPFWLLSAARRKLCELVGYDGYSRPAYNDIETKLEKYLPEPAFFVEAGAVDGFFESNTYYLDCFRGWRGILIEPIPNLYRRISVNRPKAQVFNCALVAEGFPESVIAIEAAHALSKVASANGANVMHVPTRTLTSILDETRTPVIDLLSLDVEGYELEVLKGLDFARYSPRFLLIECLSDEHKVQLSAFLGSRYKCIDQFSYRDYFFALSNEARE